MGRRMESAARVTAALALAAMGFAWGWRSGLARTVRLPELSACDPSQLIWVEEGIRERIAALEDDLALVLEMESTQKTTADPGR